MTDEQEPQEPQEPPEPQAPLSERVLVDTNIYQANRRYYIRVQGWNEHPTRRTYIRTWIPCRENAAIEDARAIRKRIHRDLKFGRFVADRYRDFVTTPTLKDAYEDALKQRQIWGIKPKTIVDWELQASKWLPELGALPIAEIDYYDVREWWEDWVQRAPSPGAANKALKILRAVFAHSIRTGWRPAGANPASAVSVVRNPRKLRPRPITADDWRRLSGWLAEYDRRRCITPGGDKIRWKFDYMGHWAYAVTQVSLAARGGEVCGLEWRDILWDKNIIVLRETKTAPTLLRPVSPQLLRLLREHGRLMHVYGSPPVRDNDLIFPGITGKRTNPTSRFRKVFRRALQELDLPWGRVNRGWTPHDLRRWGITLLYETGATTRDVMEYVGHSTAEAHRRYLQASPSRLRFLADEISVTAIPSTPLLIEDSTEPKT